MVDVNAAIGASVGVGGALLLLLLVSFLTRPPRFDLNGKVVLVTGGSSGIGKACCQYALAHGASVALVARKEAVLRAAVAELSADVPDAGSRISAHAADVTDDAAVSAAVKAAAAAHGGRIDVVINSAGVSGPRVFDEVGADEFEATYRINVVGSRNATFAALPFMRGAAGGRVVFVSSQAGQAGVYGFTAYSASKFALRGLFESLSQELYTRNILVTLAFPPDTDTPMLHEENKYKPAITKMLSESSATVGPEVVARSIMASVVHWAPYASVGFDGWMLSTMTVGMGPAGSIAAAAVQVATMGLWRLVGLVFVQSWYRIVRAHDRRGAGWAGGAAPGPAAPAQAAASDDSGGPAYAALDGKPPPAARPQQRRSSRAKT